MNNPEHPQERKESKADVGVGHKVAENVYLKIVARFSMALLLPVLTLLFGLATAYIKSEFNGVAEKFMNVQQQINELKATNSSAAVNQHMMANKVAVLESQQKEESRATDVFRSSTLDKLDSFQQILMTVSTQIASMSAQLNATKEYQPRRYGMESGKEN